MTRLALLRHGHTKWNREGRIQGRSDIPLDDAASADLAQLALPAPWSSARLWSSPMARARATASQVADHQPETASALTEMNWGDWEGQHGAQLLEDPISGYRNIEDWGWDFRPPNGESPRDIAARLAPWVDALSGDNVAVCHIGIMRVLLAQAYDWPFSGPAPFRIKRNRLYVLSWTSGRFVPDPEPVRLVQRPSQ